MYESSSEHFLEPPTNQKEFIELKKIADHQNLADAQFKVATCFEDGKWVSKSLKKACHYYKEAADQGHIEGQIYLAHLYDTGRGVEQNYTQAFHYYKLAADQGDSTALAMLGKLYAEGKGVEKSLDQAFKYCQRAATDECPIAWSYLAEAYENGQGVQKSPELAAHWRKKIFNYTKENADNGDPVSQTTLGNFFENGQGIEKSLEKAVHYYQLAARQNDSKGLRFLADCYATGKGIEKSIPEAVKNYKLAADQQDVYAQYFFAKFILENKIDESQEEQAIHYLKLAIKNNPSLQLLSFCENDLAECFENGIGGRKSFKKALYYYKRASLHGNISAKTRLEILETSNNKLNSLENKKKSHNYSKNLQSAIKTKVFENNHNESQLLFWVPQETNTKLICTTNIELKADQGDACAKYDCGMFLLDTDRKSTKEKSINYLKMSAEQNFIPSLLALGHYYSSLYFESQKIDPSLIKMAYYYYERFLEEKAIRKEKYSHFFSKAKVYFKKKSCKHKATRKKIKKFKLTIKVYEKKENLKKISFIKEVKEDLVKMKEFLKDLDEQKKRNYRIKARKMHNLYLPENAIFYPNSQAIDLTEYLKSMENNFYDVKFLISSIEKYKDTACYLYGICDYDREEIDIIRNAMLENPRLTFIAPKSDFYALWLAFNRAGYSDNCLKRSTLKIEGKPFYVLLFIGLPFQD